MSNASKAPRAPIERPKPASSRFSFYRRTNFFRDKFIYYYYKKEGYTKPKYPNIDKSTISVSTIAVKKD